MLVKFCVRKSFIRNNPDPDYYKCSCYDIGFDVHGSFSLAAGSGFGKNVIIFGADMNSSVHVDNNKKRYLNSW